VLAGSPALDQLAALTREAGVVPVLAASGEPRGYRHRARIAVRGRAALPKLGIFKEGTHRVVDIPGCVVHHPLINDVVVLCKQALRDVDAQPYADVTHRGLVRYLQIVVERSSQTVQIVVVANSDERTPLNPLLSRLREQLGERLQGLFWSAHSARTNAILGASCEKVSGTDAVHEELAGADVFFPPDAYGQANLAGYERIVRQIGKWVDDDADVLELYAGTGAIGLSLMPRVKRVRFCELSAGSLRGLRMGIDTLSPERKARTEVLPGHVATHAALARGGDIVIADPPRKGLDAALLSALCEAPPRRFIYMSCGLESFLRDARHLMAGGLKLCAVHAYDLFPFTDHVEILAQFERKPT
jgi:tRNA/tmRNA/rRNA uracil-C5-methylase (TrmA/RlmC/RlmD family)